MSLEGILNISGKPGLYKALKTTAKSVIVESLDDKKRRFAVSASTRMAALGEISIYTMEDQEMLITVLRTMQENKESIVMPASKADEKELRAYFVQILPDYDVERVYKSDISKIIKWYNTLEGVVSFAEEKDSTGEEEE